MTFGKRRFSGRQGGGGADAHVLSSWLEAPPPTEAQRGVRVTSPLAQHCGKVWSWKEIGSVFLYRTQANAGKNKFGLAGLASLEILKAGVVCPSG